MIIPIITFLCRVISESEITILNSNLAFQKVDKFGRIGVGEQIVLVGSTISVLYLFSTSENLNLKPCTFEVEEHCTVFMRYCNDALCHFVVAR